MLTHRTLGHITAVVSLFSFAASATAQTGSAPPIVVSPTQSTFERGWIDVNFGIALAAEDAFSMASTGELFEEPATFSAEYSLPRGASSTLAAG